MKEDIVSIKLRRDELNRNLGGGLPKNSLILLQGPDGSGKSILSQRIVYGLLENDKTVTYISTELNTIGFVEQMKSLDYDVKYHMLDDKLLFIPMFPFLGKAQLDDDFLEKLLNNRKVFQNDFIIFDTLSFLMIQENMGQEKVFDIINHIKNLISIGKTIIICVDPDHLHKQFLTMLRSISDVYLNLELKEFAGGIVRVIAVNRFKRPADTILTAIPFKVEPGKGLAIEIASFT